MKERERGKYCDYADCIDYDYSIVDADDSVCDINDGLTLEEVEAYNNECDADKAFMAGLHRIFGFFDMHLWKNPLNRWE